MAEEKSSKGIVAFIKASKTHLGVVVLITLLVLSLGGVTFIDYMEKDTACGNLCHNHQEYYDQYQGTVHQKAGVMCKTCHTKPGLGFVSSQITNTGNVFKFFVLGGKYKESFEVIKEDEPLEKFVPPNKNCVQGECHVNWEYAIEGDKGTVLWSETHTTDPKVNCVVCHGNVMFAEEVPTVYPEDLPPG